MKPSFTVGLTNDFLTADGQLIYRDIGLGLLSAEKIGHHFFDTHHPCVMPDQLANLDAVISLTPKYDASSFRNVDRLLAVVRFGVGYDMVDVAACTEAGVLLCITKGAVDYSMAEATLGYMLALSHRMGVKDRLVRDGRWQERGFHMGTELRERTLGIIGLGGIGKKLVELITSFGMAPVLAFDPFLTSEEASRLGVQKVDLETLLRKSDFVSVNCPLTNSTRNLIGAKELGWMKPDAFLINASRGGIVTESALVLALQNKQIAGAGIDVFDDEPAKSTNPFCQLDNVILSPHCIGWTDELFRDIGQLAATQVIALSFGEIPSGIVNPEVIDHLSFQKKLARFHSPQLTNPSIL